MEYKIKELLFWDNILPIVLLFAGVAIVVAIVTIGNYYNAKAKNFGVLIILINLLVILKITIMRRKAVSTPIR